MIQPATIEQLEKKATDMSAFLEVEPSDEIEEMISRVHLLGILISQSGKLLADAKYHRDGEIETAIKYVLKDISDSRLSATAINKYIESKAKDKSYLVNILERINKTATHQLDGLRTIISYRKQEYSTLHYSPRQ